MGRRRGDLRRRDRRVHSWPRSGCGTACSSSSTIWQSEYAAAQTQVRELSTLQIADRRAGHEASLFTYLEHPWPRTQLLAEVVRPLPERRFA